MSDQAPPPGNEAAVRAALARLEVEFEALACDPSLADTAVFCAHFGIPLAEAANAIVVASKKEPRRHACCIVPGTHRLDVNRSVRKLLGVRKLSFASAEETRALTGMEIGGVTPFGLPPELPIYVDARIPALPRIILGGGSRRWKIRCAPAELEKLPGVQVVEGLAKEAPPS